MDANREAARGYLVTNYSLMRIYTMGSIQDIMDQMPNMVKLSFGETIHSPGYDPDYGEFSPERVTVVLSFSKQGFGFGEIAIVTDNQGRTFVDGEHMNKETVKSFINNLLDSAIYDTDSDPDRHKLYNNVIGRVCISHCEICHSL